MKKILLSLLLFVILILASCSNGKTTTVKNTADSSTAAHVHKTHYESDSMNHSLVCELCGSITLTEAHKVNSDGVCVICGREGLEYVREKLEITYPLNGDEVNVYKNEIVEYMKAESEADIIRLLEASASGFDQSNLTIKWKKLTDAKKYLVELSENEEMTQTVFSSITRSSYEDVKNLIPFTNYYMRVSAYDSDGEILEVSDVIGFTLRSDITLRQISIDGMHNVRDLGGYLAGESRIKYGLLYRGGKFDTITDAGKETFIEKLGIKNEIDLRYDGTDLLLDDRVSYNLLPIKQFTQIIPDYTAPVPVDGTVGQQFDSASVSSIKEIFTMMSDINNYPIYFHCNAGADRTGTLAFLIEGLLGAKYDDMARDFELTSFSRYGHRFRSEIVDGKFQESGIFQNDSNNFVAFDLLYNLMMDRYSNGGTLSDAVENYLISVCEITEAQITSIKSILLG